MRLKKLELTGFKSFADRTQVYFDKGVTCVVGPNGCGKSNISDSIRWVLGERSAKILRGAKMEDVIFAGTQLRKPVSFAEVSLTIDNKDRGLPIDYHEVTITRRLHRSGESEYLINKTPCRLKDIQDLILDTGIGSNSYSMIEQGRIDYILNASSDERRFLIEEAAGISKYKVKKEEALRKLERTEQNLLRLNDIVTEVQRNIQYAERQAKRAQKYQEQFEKLKELEIKRAFLELSHIEKDKKGLEIFRSARQKEIDNLAQKLQEMRTGQETMAASLKEILGHYSAEEAKRYDVKGQIDQNEQQFRFNQEKKVALATRRGEIQQEQAQIQEQSVKTRAEMEMKQREISSIETQRGDAEQMFEAARRTLEQVEDHLDSAKLIFNETKDVAAAAASAAARLKNEYHRLCVFLETSVEQKKKQQAGADRYRKELSQWVARKEDCEKSLEMLGGRLSEIAAEKQRLEDKRKAFQEKMDALSARMEAAQRTLHEKETRRFLLEEIDASTGISQERIVQELNDEERSLVKGLRDVLHVREGYEWAVEAVLGDFARAMIAEENAAGVRLLQLLLEKKSAPLGFWVKRPAAGVLPDSAHEIPPVPGVTIPLSEAVKIQAGYEDILLPFFERVYVLESLDPTQLEHILAAAESVKLVTREGTILGPHRRVYFRQGQLSAEQSFFRRGAEIETLKREAGELAEALGRDRELAEETNREFAETEDSLEKAEAEFLDCKIQRESFESLKKGMQERLGTYQQELELIFNEGREIQTKEEEAIRERTHLEIEIMRAEEKQRQVRSEQENLIHDMERMERTKAHSLKDYADHKAKLDNLIERKKYLEEATRLLAHHERRDQERLSALSHETERIGEREREIEAEDEKLRSRQEELRSEMTACDVRLEKIRTEKEDAESALSSIELKIREVQEEKHVAEESLHENEKKGMDLGYQERNIHERLSQAYKIDLAALNPMDYPMAEEERAAVQETIDQLSKRIESIGTVNLLAIEEYDELKERYDFLMTQQKDLEDAKVSLMEAIRKINRTTKGLFENTFQEVQKAFTGYYQTLFGGGEAKLVLIDESNPLESGVDIIVRPPGKKLQHISLLSGGEKALTALALLFALFSIKPSPFCVLDEVDAPLDEANIDRFLAVVKPFLQSSQFIIVTHNRKTIAMGDALYGVTMEEAGVSKIVSVKVARELQDEAFEEAVFEEGADASGSGFPEKPDDLTVAEESVNP